MGASRNLQGEIDRVLKKVQEGVDVFDSIWNKNEKFKADLKREIKKLQKYRDQINTWMQSSEIKDEKALMDARKQIEREMERYKISEQETKTKAFSKEVLGQQPKTDPREKAKSETRYWLNNGVSELGNQIDSFEAETEGLSVNKGKTRPPRLDNSFTVIMNSKSPTLVVWDIKSCPFPDENEYPYFPDTVRSVVFSYCSCSRVQVDAYGSDGDYPRSIARRVHNRMSLIYSSPNTHAQNMISGMNFWAMYNPPPASFFVISGDKALLSTLKNFRSRNYNIFVTHPDGYCAADLVATASCLWDFKSFIHNGPPYHPRTEMLPLSSDFSKLSLKDVERCQTRPDQNREKLALKGCPKRATGQKIQRPKGLCRVEEPSMPCSRFTCSEELTPQGKAQIS